MISKEKAQENLAVLTSQLEEGVKGVFESTRYKEYLCCLSKFHNYSFNNVILIYLQFPQASLVAGFNDWKNKHNRFVKKGEKAIKILAPIKGKQDVLVPIKDEDENVIEVDGKALTEVKQKNVVYGFRPVSVFDVSQTEGEPLHSLGQELQQGVDNYEDIMKSIISISPYAIRFQHINSGAKGYCSYSEEIIAIQEGMSEAQTIKTALHEVAHAILHNPEIADNELTRAEKEIQAESIAFVVANYIGVDTSEYSFDYVATWSNDKELEELKNSLDVIQKTSKKILTRLTEKYGDILKVKEAEFIADVEELRNLSESAPRLEQRTDERPVLTDEERSHPKIRYSKEENEQIITQLKADVRIEDYAQRLGFTVQRVGKYLTLKEHDSIRINPTKNLYIRNSTGTKGSIIDFVMEFEKLDKTSAIKKLVDFGRVGPSSTPVVAPSAQKETPPLILPQKDSSLKNVYAYLLKTRHIDRRVVDSWVKQGLLYQDRHKNCVFVSHNKSGNPVFASLKGTNTNRPFSGDVEGSNYDICHFFNSEGKSLVVCEAVIDLMSVQTILLQNGRNLNDYNYLSLNGSYKTHSIINALKECPVDKVILAVDNDNAGEVARQNLKELVFKIDPNVQIIDYIPPNEKDWNEELVAQFYNSNSIRQDNPKKGLTDLQNEAAAISESINQSSHFVSQKQELNQGE